LAGFQVTLIGRFWVTAEDRRSQCSVSFIEVREVAKVRGQVSRGTGEFLFHARQADKKVGIQRFT
jgi:hypothetical protein